MLPVVGRKQLQQELQRGQGRGESRGPRGRPCLAPREPPRGLARATTTATSSRMPGRTLETRMRMRGVGALQRVLAFPPRWTTGGRPGTLASRAGPTAWPTAGSSRPRKRRSTPTEIWRTTRIASCETFGGGSMALGLGRVDAGTRSWRATARTRTGTCTLAWTAEILTEATTRTALSFARRRKRGRRPARAKRGPSSRRTASLTRSTAR
mmetsp:Transcript_10113/g.30852  ORF Transcript_10113/g.30852 Transcript_10113/m.30852 type:complete len:210 (+) Transcript_10113:324-953(+)